MSDTMNRWMIYGANGYTGRLTVAQAVADGLSPVVAGRSEDKIRPIAEQHGLQWRVFDLDDADATRRGIAGLRAVLHCAGPFSMTSKPMVQACIAERVHYLDITGEISVFAGAHRRGEEAARRDVLLIPGVGFDVVPTDCLAATLVEKLPAATHLTLAFEAAGGPSPGTAKTAAEGMSSGGCVRRDGELKPVPPAWKTRTIPFAHGERMAATIPWGDVYTAFVSTGVPHIEVYLAMPPSRIGLTKLTGAAVLLGLRPVKNFIKRRIEKSVSGPSDEKRAATDAQLWGQVVSSDGRKVSATMTTPNGYDLTVTASLAITRHVIENDIEGGFYTPSLLMGAGFAQTLPGVSLHLLEEH